MIICDTYHTKEDKQPSCFHAGFPKWTTGPKYLWKRCSTHWNLHDNLVLDIKCEEEANYDLKVRPKRESTSSAWPKCHADETSLCFSFLLEETVNRTHTNMCISASEDTFGGRNIIHTSIDLFILRKRGWFINRKSESTESNNFVWQCSSSRKQKKESCAVVMSVREKLCLTTARLIWNQSLFIKHMLNSPWWPLERSWILDKNKFRAGESTWE